MDNVSRPMILRIGTPTLDKDMKRIKKLLISAGYQEVEEGKYAHGTEPMLSAVLNMGEITDSATGEILQEVIELILSDAVTGAPISGATANVIGEPISDTDNVFTVPLTDSGNGEYFFDHTGGSYTIEIQADGYVSQTVNTGYLEGCGKRSEMDVKLAPTN